MIAYGEKPSPAIRQMPEVVPHVVKPHNDSQDQVTRPAQTTKKRQTTAEEKGAAHNLNPPLRRRLQIIALFSSSKPAFNCGLD